MSFLVAIVMALTGKRRSRAFICIPFILAFMALTGNTPSVVRAGVMQIFLLTAPLVHREADPVTDLGAALMLLLVINPFSAANVGLQLSFAAIAGVLLVTPKLSSSLFRWALRIRIWKISVFKRLLLFICSVVSASLGALLFTAPLTAIHFKYVSIISPVANVLTLWAVSAAFTLGIFACMLGFIALPLGKCAAWIAQWPVRYFIEATLSLSRIPFAAVYTSSKYIRIWLAYILAVLAAAFLDKNFRPRAIILTGLCTLSLSAAITLTVVSASGAKMLVTVLDVSQGQSIACVSEGQIAIID